MRTAVLAALVACPTLAVAVEPDEILQDPGLEERARSLSRELRCMVCQNQSIDDSNAPLARDLRLLVRERLKAGDSDGKVIDFVVDRYGEFVLLRPRFAWHTALLWLAPVALLASGALTLLVFMRRRAASAGGVGTAEPAPLSPEEEKRLAAILRRDAE
jgi:cytochrome c-type biogenesis protein CcmH